MLLGLLKGPMQVGQYLTAYVEREATVKEPLHCERDNLLGLLGAHGLELGDVDQLYLPPKDGKVLVYLALSNEVFD